MKSRIQSRPALVAAAGLALCLSFAPRNAAVSHPSAPRSSVAVQDDPLNEIDLKDRVRRAVAIGDQQGVATLLRNNPKNTIIWIIWVIEASSEAPSEAVSKDMTILRTGWRAAFDSDFFDNLEAYFARLTPEVRRTRRELRDRFNLKSAPFHKLLAEEHSPERTGRAAALSAEFEGLAQAFEEMKDLYYSSGAYHNAGYLVDSTVVHEAADAPRAYALLKASLEARKKLDLRDRVFQNLTIDVARLEPLVVPPGADSVDTASPIAGVGVGPATRVAGTFEAIPEIDAFERLGYGHDAVYMAWPTLFLGRVDTSVQFGGMSNSPTLLRTGASSAEVKGVDGESTPLPLTGNIELVRTTVGPADKPRPWAFLATVPTEKEFYQGFEVNYEPSPDQMTLPVAPAAAMRYEVVGTQVRVFDDNMDGVYGPGALTWGYPGIKEGEFQADVDGVAIGSAKRLVPFSELIQIGKQWVRLESIDGGLELAWQPATLRTGKVKLEAKGLSPFSVVVRGTGPLENCYFDLAAGKGGVDLPIGQYRLVQGVVREGRRLQVTKALILGVEGKAGFAVEEGKTTVFAVGAPFDIDFRANVTDKNVRLVANTMTVTGQAGERYHRLWGYPLRPEVSLRKVGAKKGERPQKMPIVLDQSTVNEKGLAVAWYPMDLELKHDFGTVEVEVQVSEKKHPLFGKLESSWK